MRQSAGIGARPDRPEAKVSLNWMYRWRSSNPGRPYSFDRERPNQRLRAPMAMVASM